MTATERRLDRGRRLAARSLLAMDDEFRDGRIGAGLTQARLGTIVGLSPSEISRIERGESPRVSFATLAVIAAALGLDLPLRAYPDGDAARDAGQLALMARFRVLLAAVIRHRTEVPLSRPGDRRAWDEVLDGPGWSLPVEAESRLRDVQALNRRLNLKLRDSGFDRVLLLVADTRHNRRMLRLHAADLAVPFPVSGRVALAALRSGRQPEGSAIILV